MIELIGSHPRLTGKALQTMSSMGHDGFALMRVLAYHPQSVSSSG
ncbi:hypothetical protein ACFV29_42210 [Streptomyces sp. NPDC059690]